MLAATTLVSYAMWRFVRSPFGLTLLGIRDSESRMKSLGYNVPLHLFVGFAVSFVSYLVLSKPSQQRVPLAYTKQED